MPYSSHEPISRQVTIVVGLAVVSFMSFGLALSFYQNVLFEQTLSGIAAKNNALRNHIDRGEQKLLYFQSSQYKDKYAKEHLGKINPGEKVLVIAQDPRTAAIPPNPLDAISEQQEAAFLELMRQMPVIQHWKLYLFERDRVEELKRSFYRT